MKWTIRRNVLMGLAGWLTLSVAFGGTSMAAAPPPPQFVTIPNDTHVVAIWDNSNARGQAAPAVAQPLAGSDTALISKSADAAQVAAGGTLQYSIVVTNATNVKQTFRVTDTLPASLSYISNTATVGFVYNAASTSLTFTHVLTAFQGDIISATATVIYTEIITDTGAHNICQAYFTACDDDAIVLAGVPFRYLGFDYTTVTLDSNGFVLAGTANPGSASENQHLPDVAGPNTVIAPFWDDFDLAGRNGDPTGGGDWLWEVRSGTGTDSNATYLVVEWHNAQRKSELASADSFQVWIQLYGENIQFAYHSLTGTKSSAKIGFENSDGTLGHSYLYNGTGHVPGAGAALRLSATYTTAQLGFRARAKPGLRGCTPIINTANLSTGAGTLRAMAVASVNMDGLCLPLILR